MHITKDMITESHQSVVHNVPMLSYCGFCGTRYFVSLLTFTQTHGACSCSWQCCPTAEPGNQAHARHMRVRPATIGDIWDAEQGIIRDHRAFD